MATNESGSAPNCDTEVGFLHRLLALEPSAWSCDKKWDKKSDTIKTTFSDGLRVRINVKHIGASILPDFIKYSLFVNDKELYSETVANTPEACLQYKLVTPLSQVYEQWFRAFRMPVINAELEANPEYQAVLARLKAKLRELPEESQQGAQENLK